MSGQVRERECGSCCACCVHLGIKELNKYSGVTCRHVDASPGLTRRCRIYARRPSACSDYQCLWRRGGMDDDLRPSESGLLVTLYQLDETTVSATINVFDHSLAGDFVDAASPLGRAVQFVAAVGVNDIRIAASLTGRVVHLAPDSTIHPGRLLKADGPEDLNFEVETESVGTWKVVEKVP